MSAQLPIIELIVQDIVDKLKSIRVANDYLNDVGAVERANPGIGNVDKDRRLVVLEGNPARVDDEPLGFSEWQFPVQIICTVVESETSTVPIGQRLNTLRSDVEKCLTFGTSFARAGLAIDTRVVDPDYGPTSLAAHEGEVIVNVVVHFRTQSDNPYSQ